MSAASLSACGTLKPLPDVPRPQPVEAMQPEPESLCQLPSDIAAMELGEALNRILLCHAADAEQYRRLERKWKELAAWIRGG